jgi:plastocyanin
MVKKLVFFSAIVLAVFAAAHCNNDNNTITGPPILTATPSPGPGTPSVTPGGPTATATPTIAVGTPTPTVTPAGAAATVDVGPNGGMTFVDRVSGSNTTSIPVGGAVHWNWAGGPHSSTSGTCTAGCTPDGNWDSGIQSQGATFDHTFPAAGTFPYFCEVHGSLMTGTVIVQ